MCERKIELFLGAMADKELDAMVPLFLPLAKKVFLTAPAMPRAMKPEELRLLCERNCNGVKAPEFVLCETVENAVRMVQKEGKEEIIVVIGSLYLAGEVKQVLS